MPNSVALDPMKIAGNPGWRPCLSIRGVIAPPGTHSKVRMSILLGELNRIQNRHRPHIAYVPTEDFLCSRPLVDFDDEAKHIRAATDKLIRYCHTSVPHESRPARIITTYDRYAPEGRYVSKYSNDIPSNIHCMSYYTEPSRVTIGRGHLACMSYAGGRGYPRRKHLYSDETRDIGDEIKFRSYYSRNTHPSRNDDALLLPTGRRSRVSAPQQKESTAVDKVEPEKNEDPEGFASRILLPDRRLLPTDEGRALIFTSKLVKPVSSGLSIKKEKPEKKPAPKQKTRAQAIEDVILAEESAKISASRPQPPKEASPPPAPVAAPVTAPEPEPEPEAEPEPVREPEPEPAKEPTPPPAETKTKPKKETKKKSSMKSTAPVVEAEPVVADSPPAAAAPAEEAPVAEELMAAEVPQPSEPALAPEPVAELVSDISPEPVNGEKIEIAAAEPVTEAPAVEPTEQPAEPIEVETEVSQPVEQETVPEPFAADPVSDEVPQVDSIAETAAPSEIVNEAPTEPAIEEQKIDEGTALPVPEEGNETETSNISVEEKIIPVTNEEVPVESESTVTEAANETAEPQEEAQITTPAEDPVVEEIKVESEQQIFVEDPTSRLEGEAEPALATDAVAEEKPAETPAPESAEPEQSLPATDDPQISEVVESPSSENLPETTESIIEEPTTPIAEQ